MAGPFRGLNFGPSNRALQPAQPQQRRPQVALQLEDFDAQLQSPLYDGTIPPEIRKMIFEYAMTEYVDPESPYPTNTDYTRPNYVGKKKVSINLLLLCKRSYLETHHLPPVNKEHVFWYFRGPRRYGNMHGYFARFKSSQLDLVKEIHLFTQQFWLERSNYWFAWFLQGIEKLKITLRRGDWWNNEYNAPLAITPQRPGKPEFSAMKDDWGKEERGEIVVWDERSWGSSFRHLQSLKELEMEFETYDYKKGELEEIVRHAVKWKFPMGNGKFLSCAGGLACVKTNSWRGPPCGWFECPQCQGQVVNCEFCEKMNALKMEGKGPMLIVMSGLRWKLTAADTDEASIGAMGARAPILTSRKRKRGM